METFATMFERATGTPPYRYQERIAAEGLPELLSVPTGCGKTAAVVLGWLWRRRFHPDEAVRTATPRWLVFCLPMRVLTEQIFSEATRWLGALGLDSDADSVGRHVIMGGAERPGDRLRLEPERDAVVVGTMDMLLSRALNRGYGTSRFSWPVDFGLFHNGCHWVFDEVQLMGPGLPTSRQLEGLRKRLGTALASSSTWMSATVEPESLFTVDNPTVGAHIGLDANDLGGPLGVRLNAEKTILKVEVDPRHRERDIAAALLGRHRPGTLSLAVVNTVPVARALHGELGRLAPEAEVLLLHSRFRPPDRRLQVDQCLAPVDPAGAGRIVVSTQVLEAGIDLSAATLFSDAAPWPSIIQRAGRCNRDGNTAGATLLWAPPARPEPYLPADVAASIAALDGLTGAAVTPATIRDHPVDVTRPVHAVLRRRDLLGLFDTAPDLSGNDVDIAPYIRVTEDLDVLVAWRDLGGKDPTADEPKPGPDELCPVPLGTELRAFVAHRGWFFDHLADTWVRLEHRLARPGIVILLDAAEGGYRPESGWDPTSKSPVPLEAAVTSPGFAEPEEAVGDDPITFGRGRWVALVQHLEDVGVATQDLLERLAPAGLSPSALQAAVRAAELHDIGKAHEVFQATMLRSADDAEEDAVRAGGPWAKSGGSNHPRHERRFFRHELASLLALLGDAASCLDDVDEADLVRYLVAAHHGRVRLGIRSLPGREDLETVLGIREGDRLPAISTPPGRLPEATLSLAAMRVGGWDDQPSWSERALNLLGRNDLGPFRLGFLEAVVRLADWRASADPPGGA